MDEHPVGGFIWTVLTLAIALYLGYVIVNTVTNKTYQDGYTDRYNAYAAAQTAREQEQTRRIQAQEQTERVQSEQWNATLRQWAWPTAAGVILVIVAIQAGRTLRHRETERTKRRALLVMYMGHMLPGANAQIGQYRGELAIINHDDGEIIPYGVAEIELSANRLLPG